MWRLPSPGGASDATSDDGLATTLVRLEKTTGGFFDATRPLRVARAPGRLDVMGGIADYSGALALELPLAEGTWAFAQDHPVPELVVASAASDIGIVTIPLSEVLPATGPLPYPRARSLFAGLPGGDWAAYALGGLVVLHRECGRPLRHGLKILIHSEVPTGAGVSSSAALVVATLQLFASIVAAPLDERALALLAQKVENVIVGAPCGVMDQLTVVAGRRDHLAEILCQPAELVGHLPIPAGLQLFGIDSGIRHAVSGADYTTVRAAAFMGYRIIAEVAGLPVRELAPGLVQVDDARFGGYLANVTPAQWRDDFCHRVPPSLLGQSFLDRYRGFTDTATTIDPGKTYAVRACTAHPIRENDRVRRFRELLASGAAGEAAQAAASYADSPLGELGGLMYESLASYSACGLGSDGTDALVELVRAAGAESGLYGAKITGAGSGGTVAVLGGAGARAALDVVVGQYGAATGRQAKVFAGSSAGANTFGVRWVG